MVSNSDAKVRKLPHQEGKEETGSMYGIDWEVVDSYKGSDVDGYEEEGITPPDSGSSGGLGVASHDGSRQDRKGGRETRGSPPGFNGNVIV